MPWTRPPSICCLTISGLTTRPQSTAQTARSTRSRWSRGRPRPRPGWRCASRRRCGRRCPCRCRGGPPSQPPIEAAVAGSGRGADCRRASASGRTSGSRPAARASSSMKHLGEEAGVAVRAPRQSAGRDADLGRHMVDRDVGDRVRRHRAGDGGAVGANQPPRRAEPLRRPRAAVGRGDPRLPAEDQPALARARRSSAPRPAGGSVSAGVSWTRDQVSWTGRPEPHGEDRRLLDRFGLQLAAIAAAGERRIERDLALGEAGGARRGGAGEARRLGRGPDFEPVAGEPRGRGQGLTATARFGATGWRSGPRPRRRASPGRPRAPPASQARSRSIRR